MNEPVRRVLRSWAELKHRKNLGEGINGQPQPQDLIGAAEPGAQFVQLEVRELEMAKGPLVQGVCVLASSGQPGDDGGLSKAEHTLCSRGIQPFSQCRQH